MAEHYEGPGENPSEIFNKSQRDIKQLQLLVSRRFADCDYDSPSEADDEQTLELVPPVLDDFAKLVRGWDYIVMKRYFADNRVDETDGIEAPDPCLTTIEFCRHFTGDVSYLEAYSVYVINNCLAVWKDRWLVECFGDGGKDHQINSCEASSEEISALTVVVSEFPILDN